MRIPIIGGSYKGRSVNINPQQTVNFYPILDMQGGKHTKALIGTPGLVEFCDLSSVVQIRNMIVMGDYLYAVGGTTLYKIDSDGAETAIGGVLSTSTGHVWMAHDGTYLMIVDPGVDGYTQTGAGNLTVIADADFPTPSSLTWQDGYFIITKADSGRFYISASYDPTTWDALDYATAEANPDELVAGFSSSLALWLFGKETTEVWYNSGASAFPFERISGAFITTGLAAAASLAGILGTLFWLNDRREVIQSKGFSADAISTDQIAYHFDQFTTVSDAVGFCYTQEGHTFYVLTFPTEDETWVFDATTNLWHERESYPIRRDGSHSRWRANCYAYFAGKHLVGDYLNGKIYELDLDTYTDDGEVIRRRRVTQIVNQDRKNLFFHKFEVEFEAGVGLVSGQGSDPQAMLRISDDGGHSWGNEHWRDIGEIGRYGKRAIWRRLGRSRNRTLEIAISDPVKSIILGAYADIELGDS